MILGNYSPLDQDLDNERRNRMLEEAARQREITAAIANKQKSRRQMPVNIIPAIIQILFTAK